MTPFEINQDAHGGVYIQEQVEQVKHSTVLKLLDLSLCGIYALGNLFFFCDLIVLLYNLTAAITNLTFVC